MHQMEFSGIKAFLHRRYAIRLGRRYVSAAASFMVLGLVGCSEVNNIDSSVAQSVPPKQQDPATQVVTPVVNSKLIAANTKFGFKLFSEIFRQDSSKNIFISPASVAIALAMTYNGASGETKQAMANTLELQEINLQEVNSGNAAMLAALENTDSIELTIANSLWAKQEYPLKQDFLQRQKFYKAKVTNLDFSDRAAPTVINNWVNQSTRGRIERIIESINSNDVLFLINATYFKGKWTTQFDKNQTDDYPFYLAAGNRKHPMMSQTGEYRYYETEKFQAVSFPYGKDRKLSLYVFLPNQNSSLSNFYKDLNAQNWEKWMTLFRNREGLVRLPRFSMESELTLNDTLKALGMEVAFGDEADFSGIGDNLSISEVKHKTFVEVNEEGTEAAAATSVTIAVTAAPAQEPFQMIVNRPFFCAIRDNQTGTILFMSSIIEP